MDTPNWLTISLVVLGAAVLAVPLARWLGLGSIIGYLAAGIAIGPYGARLIAHPEAVLHAAEFGVVLMLFLVGLELDPKRLWAMRRPIFGWGSVQMVGSTLLLFALGLAAGVPWKPTLVAALGLALSSTAIGLAVIQERNLMPTSCGQSVLGVMLFQDVAAIPILALLPLLGTSIARAGDSGWLDIGRAVAVVAIIVVGGHYLLRPALRWIASSRTPEIFTAAALLLVVAVAWLMQTVGMSMALGAFLAGVLLAESEYRRALETDIEPFKGLMLGLFFIAVGMSIEFAVVLDHPGVVLAIVAGFVAAKALVLLVLARMERVAPAEWPVFVIVLAQGGEFGFVVFQAAAQARIIDAPTSSLLVAAVAISMLLTPLLLVISDRWLSPRLARGKVRAAPRLQEPQAAPVIIAGFGRYGQIVGRMLFANGIEATVLDHDAEEVEAVRRRGMTAFYGDATRLDMLRIAGAGQARVIVVAIDDVDQSLKLVDVVRQEFPHLSIVARARNVDHYLALRERGVRMIERETFESALLSARTVLELMGWQRHHARTLAMRFKHHNVGQLELMKPHLRDERTLIAMAKAGRQQLEQLWAQERAEAEQHKRRPQWHAPPAGEAAREQASRDVVPGETSAARTPPEADDAIGQGRPS